jgi:hypothetical protein
VEKEVQRLIAIGFFKESRSPIACCMVVAPKATAPFFRICVDYRPVNLHVKIGHYPIPFVQHSLEKIAKFRVFLDLDWVNAFHQVRLGHAAPLVDHNRLGLSHWRCCGRIKRTDIQFA